MTVIPVVAAGRHRWPALAFTLAVLAIVALAAGRPGAGAQPAVAVILTETEAGTEMSFPPGSYAEVDPADGTVVTAGAVSLVPVEGEVVAIGFAQGGTVTIPPAPCAGAPRGRRVIRVTGAAITPRIMPKALAADAGPRRLAAPPVLPGAGGTSQAGLAGRWQSNAGLVYVIVQRGVEFTWTVEGQRQQGRGTISGDTLEASWTDGRAAGSAKGAIRQRDAAGRPTRIEWDNGVVFTRVR